MFDATVREGVLCVRRPGTRWLSTGWNGGFSRGAVAYTVSVPEGWDETDIGVYTRQRRSEAGFAEAGPTLLTGVALDHARRARLDSVTAYATAGLSNPAALPMDPANAGGEGGRPEDGAGTDGRPGDDAATDGPPGGDDATDGRPGEDATNDDPPGPGTVNLTVGTTRALDDAAMANLIAVVAEAKAATLLAEAGFPGTTSDAVVVGCDPDGEPAQFTGSATPVGAAARACVRDAVRASLASRYPERSFPESVAAAEHGSRADREATVSRLRGADDGV